MRPSVKRTFRGWPNSRTGSPTSPQYAAERAGLDVQEIVDAARMFAGSPRDGDVRRGCGVAGTGPNMAPHGNLTEYLLLALNSVCGRWRREGEVVPNPGALLPVASPKAQALPPRAGWGKGEKLRSRDLTNSAAGLPTGALADEILYPGEGRIRALVCIGSNPCPPGRTSSRPSRRWSPSICS